MINEQTLARMKPDVMLINRSKGVLIDTKAIIKALKNKTIGYLGIDVYEEEHLFFKIFLIPLSKTMFLPDC